MFRKLGGITFWNVLTAGINFITNYFIVRWLGLDVLGQFTVISSWAAIGTLLYSFIPPNYSLIRIQDDRSFEQLLALFFMLASIGYLLYLSVIFGLGLVPISLGLFVFLAFPMAWQSYFDIVLQAENRLLLYFIFLFIVAILKIILLFLTQWTGGLYGINMLVYVNAIPQFMGILALMVWKRNYFWNISLESVRDLYQYIAKHLGQFSPYYINTFLKRLRENSIVVLFDPFVSNEVIGLFSLFTKIDQFVLGLVRNIEAFFINKENIQQHRGHFDQYFLKISLTVQGVYLIVGAAYMKVMTGNFYLIWIFLSSLLVYSYLRYLIVRAELLVRYENSDANRSELLFLFLILAGAAWCYLTGENDINAMLVSSIIAKFALQTYLVNRGGKKILRTS